MFDCISSIVCFFIFWKCIWPFVKIIFTYTLGVKLFSKRHELKHAGEWAIVTGASDGIGKEYAKQLAQESLNIMLISIDPEGLKAVSDEIKSTYNVDTRIVVADFTKTDIYPVIEAEIEKLPSIACLVNNVAIIYPNVNTVFSSDVNLELIRNMINCNNLSMCSMTKLVMPRMLSQSKIHNTNGTPTIINMSSSCGHLTIPFTNVYASTKAFIQTFSKTLLFENDSNRIRIQCVYPVGVKTASSRLKTHSSLFPKPDTYVRSALDMLGVESATYGYMNHAMFGEFLLLFPTWLSKIIVSTYVKYIHKYKYKN